MSTQPNDNGIGIIKFVTHQCYFITGSTGFIGKVLIEKMLRTAPDIRKMYLLIKADTIEVAMQRLEKEIIESELFKLLKQQHGNSYYEFMKSKLVPVAGDLSQPCLGILDHNLARQIENEVNVIIHMGAVTAWHARYDVILKVNVEGLSRFVEYALKWKKLTLFLFVSTVSISCVGRGRRGVFLEKLPCMSQNEGSSFHLPIDINVELNMASDLASMHLPKHQLSTKLAQLGQQRANIHGFYNAYEMTKAMGEMLIAKLFKGKMSTIIIRTSFTECSLREPFSGWIDGFRMLGPLILAYGRGELEGVVANPNIPLDCIPVDIAVNVIIAAMAKSGTANYNNKDDQVKVYHVSSTLANPIHNRDLFKIWHSYFEKNPLRDPKGKEIRVGEMKMFESVHDFDAQYRPLASSKHSYEKLLRMVTVYEPPFVSMARFDVKNTQKLMEDMSIEEKNMFDIDIESINWNDYFFNVHIPGIRRHILKEKTLQAKL